MLPRLLAPTTKFLVEVNNGTDHDNSWRAYFFCDFSAVAKVCDKYLLFGQGCVGDDRDSLIAWTTRMAKFFDQ